MAGYVAGWNQPGFLPGNPPDWFETFEEARGYIVHELQVVQIATYDSTLRAMIGVSIGRTRHETEPFDLELNGYVYWVMEAIE